MANLLDTITTLPTSLVSIGNTTLNQDRSRLYRSWIGNSIAVREGFDEVYRDIEEQLLPKFFDSYDRSLLGASRALIKDRLRRNLETALLITEETIENSVETAIFRAQSIHTAYLQRIGARVPTATELSRIRTRVLDSLNREYPPGSGISFRDRIQLLQIRHTNQLLRIINNRYINGGARNKILRDVNAALLYGGVGNTPVRGGSLYRQSRRLLVAEQTRAANEVENLTAKSAGIEYGYWRLSPEHIWYGGNEVCEVLANTINNDFRDITSGGRLLSMGRLRGLYRLDEWPDYPHPFCKCHMEPTLL